MRLPFRKKQLALAIGFATCTVITPLQAEESEQPIMLEELVVTAQKREQNMQDTPISMAAFNAEAMEKQSISDISDAAQYMPNVMIAESPGGSTGATIGIRGSVTINPAVTWEPTVGIYVDGVFVAKNVGGLFDVAELERMEVLRGPQGTLYGKNTVGGAINLVTRKPGEEFGGTARVKVGNYNYSDVFLSVDTGKFGDVASFNIAVNKRDRDGFYDNEYSAPGVADKFKELDSTAARFAALFDVTDDLELYYTYDMSEKDNTPSFGQFDVLGERVKRKEKGELDGAKFDTSESQGHALHVTWGMTDELTFKSITAYRDMTFEDANDYDGQAAPYVAPQNQFHTNRTFETDQFSQEFQLLGSFGMVNFVVGAYYFNENTDAQNPFIMELFTVDNKYGVDSESVALFGQADWAVTDALTLTAGLRWTQEEKDAYLERQDPTGVFPGGPFFGGNIARVEENDKWSNVSPMMVVSYLWNNGINTYFKVSQGWKSGGFNGEAADATIFANSYDPEKVTSYELGMKSRWFDNRLQANVALFHDNTKDMQISDYLGAYSEVRNAGEATVQGVELDFLMQITEGLAANVSYGYLDAEYDSFVVGGVETKDTAKFRYAPKHSATVGFDYVTDVSVGELRGRIDYSFVDSHYLYDNPVNAELTRIKSYGLLNGRISIAEMDAGNGSTVEVGFWGKNLTNEVYRINGIPVADAVGNFVGAVNYYGDPRTFGADITFRF